ncbi:MAG: LysR family transcriptional regulator, partial [Treponema sp.]|nr:LysR family transcriptional regulator [Treponema sp.]
MDIEMLRERADVIKKVRSFFNEQGYLETDTPLLAPDLIPESCLEVFETKRLSPGGSLPEPAAEPCSPSVSLRRGSPPEKPYWLIPSPEVWMKRLIAEHRANIFQICKCFRNGESLGYMHNPEFTMLEYYTMETDYLGSLSITEKLFKNLAVPFDLSPPFIKITIEEAFYKWAGFDLYKTAAEGGMEEKARRLKLNPPEGLSAGELYDLIFIHAVEPRLKLEKPVVLLDYPAFVPCLAKKKPGGKTVERWELYAHGIELA